MAPTHPPSRSPSISPIQSPTVNVTIIAPPEASDDSDDTCVDVSLAIPVLSNDTGDYDSPTTKKLTDPSNGSNVKNPL